MPEHPNEHPDVQSMFIPCEKSSTPSTHKSLSLTKRRRTMSFELLHFRDSESILKKKKMMEDVLKSLEYLDTVLFEAPNEGELLKEALKDMGWREDGTLNIMEGRRYQHKGFKNKLAIEGYIVSVL